MMTAQGLPRLRPAPARNPRYAARVLNTPARTPRCQCAEHPQAVIARVCCEGCPSVELALGLHPDTEMCGWSSQIVGPQAAARCCAPLGVCADFVPSQAWGSMMQPKRQLCNTCRHLQSFR